MPSKTTENDWCVYTTKSTPKKNRQTLNNRLETNGKRLSKKCYKKDNNDYNSKHNNTNIKVTMRIEDKKLKYIETCVEKSICVENTDSKTFFAHFPSLLQVKSINNTQKKFIYPWNKISKITKIDVTPVINLNKLVSRTKKVNCDNEIAKKNSNDANNKHGLKKDRFINPWKKIPKIEDRPIVISDKLNENTNNTEKENKKDKNYVELQKLLKLANPWKIIENREKVSKRYNEPIGNLYKLSKKRNKTNNETNKQETICTEQKDLKKKREIITGEMLEKTEKITNDKITKSTEIKKWIIQPKELKELQLDIEKNKNNKSETNQNVNNYLETENLKKYDDYFSTSLKKLDKDKTIDKNVNDEINNNNTFFTDRPCNYDFTLNLPRCSISPIEKCEMVERINLNCSTIQDSENIDKPGKNNSFSKLHILKKEKGETANAGKSTVDYTISKVYWRCLNENESENLHQLNNTFFVNNKSFWNSSFLNQENGMGNFIIEKKYWYRQKTIDLEKSINNEPFQPLNTINSDILNQQNHTISTRKNETLNTHYDRLLNFILMEKLQLKPQEFA
ncbi:hypothetical protein A3Q56_03031 [Intoshia linei]|uniref:Uncharacterized protein n=1 Tax=Intoshia linei TaxID=1819745 RepID=A0A177B4N5_9BILA|nr:hypothetical protein A3Q56_03031 [Intoshia linei]